MTRPIRVLYAFGGHRWQHHHMLHQIRSVVDKLFLVIEDAHLDSTTVDPEWPTLMITSDWCQRDALTVRQHAERSAPDGSWSTLAFDDFSAPLAAHVSSMGGMPTYSVHAAFATLYKHQLRLIWNHLARRDPARRMQIVRFSCLKFRTFGDASSFRVIAGTDPALLRFPVIVKPDCLDGSSAVMRATTGTELNGALSYALTKMRSIRPIARALGFRVPPHLILEEELLPSPALCGHGEYSAQLLSCEGRHRVLGITDKFRSGAHFGELGHVFPSVTFPPALLSTVENTLCMVLDILEVLNAITTWDIIVTADGAIGLVEGQLRPSGNHVMELYDRVSPINPFHTLLGVPRQRNPNNVLGIVLFPLPVTPVFRVERIDVPTDARVHLSVDSRVYHARFWKGPIAGPQGYVRALCVADSFSKAMHILATWVNGVLIHGRDASGSAVATEMRLPELVLGGSVPVSEKPT